MPSTNGEYPSILNNRYELQGVLGSGGMGVVWRAYDQVLQRQVACKVLSGAITQDLVFQKRFQREARHIASLSHPNIVMVYDSGTEGDYPFIVMEYVMGASLRHLLGTKQVLAVGATAALAVDVLSALDQAHGRGIVHRDVKPANLLCEFGGVVKVADFGIAKTTGDNTELTVDGGFVGTSAYASPEQLTGGTVGPASDLYSLGCVLYQCLAGIPPYAARGGGGATSESRTDALPSFPQFRPDVPQDMVDIVARSLATNPTDRFTSAREMLESLVPFVEGDELQRLLSQFSVIERADGSEESAAEATRTQTRAPARTTVAKDLAVRSPQLEAWGREGKRNIWSIAIVSLIVAAAVIAALLVFAGNGGHRSNASAIISSGGYLRPGRSVVSANGKFILVMQRDGNLVDYTAHNRNVLWESNTSGNFNSYVVMQSDGDFVLYPPGKGAPAPGQPTSALWASETGGHPGAYAELLNTGVLVVKSSTGGTDLWEASTRTP